jgi:hypothetical protein
VVLIDQIGVEAFFSQSVPCWSKCVYPAMPVVKN